MFINWFSHVFIKFFQNLAQRPAGFMSVADFFITDVYKYTEKSERKT
ncbi:hypothetical protein FSS13T_27210 [Flavobacterium saliperosum S13]|uniref:Uncharacterized protein n=1 Tax=Flavobacterium saliperosum S13 TaxID=1341155 RepID=A0ABN0QD74_9FLAO|nr:hypothetical protein FSS13T_27210 [Flavobacterium saliperosum S13]